MIRAFGQVSDVEVFFEPFRGAPKMLATPWGEWPLPQVVTQRPPCGSRGQRVVHASPNVEANCAHDYARGLMGDADDNLWIVAVCRECEHIAAPVFAELRP